MLKFGTENALFGYFSLLGFSKLLSYLKLAPSILPTKKQKCLKLGPKLSYFGIFRLEF